MCLQILYSAKKKEGKIIDLSLLTEDEKIALLELYKAAYEKANLENNASNSENESEKANSIETAISTNDVMEVSIEATDIIENDNKQTELYTVESPISDDDVQIDITYEDGDDTNSDFSGYVGDNTDISYDIDLEENTNDISSDGERYASIELSGENTTRKDSFEYTSFTPYKPKYDDIELNNNFFMADGNMGIKVDVSAKSNVGKYDYKLKKSKSNIKMTSNGAYAIADSYGAVEEKRKIPYIKIITILFSVIALGLYVTQFFYHYDTLELMKYICDFCFTISILMIFVSAITQSSILQSFKGITMFIAFGMHFIVAGVEGYQIGLYKLLHQEVDYDFIYGIVILMYLVFLYVFMILSAINSKIDKKILAYITDVLGIILVIVIIVLIRFSSMSGDLVWFYDKIPNYLGLIFYTIAIAVSNNKNR